MNYKTNTLAKLLTLLALIAGMGWIASALSITPAKTSLKQTSPLASTNKSKLIIHSDTKAEAQAAILQINSAIKSIEARLTTIEKKLNSYQVDALEKPDARQENSESPQPTLEEINDEIHESLDHFNHTFSNESIDNEWAENTESTLTGLILDGAEEGTNLLNIECRTKSCRMELSHKTEIQSFEFQQVLNNQPMSFYLQHIEGEDGEHMSIGYLVREDTMMEELINQSDENIQ